MHSLLGDALGRLCGSEQHADCRFHLKADGCAIPAHSAILVARCPALGRRALQALSGNSSAHPVSSCAADAPAAATGASASPGEGALPTIHLSAGVNPEAFSKVLQYVYSGVAHVHDAPETLCEAMAAVAAAVGLPALSALLRWQPLLPGAPALDIDATSGFGALVPTAFYAHKATGGASGGCAAGCKEQPIVAASAAAQLPAADGGHAPLAQMLAAAFTPAAPPPPSLPVHVACGDARCITADVLLAAPLLGAMPAGGEASTAPALAAASGQSDPVEEAAQVSSSGSARPVPYAFVAANRALLSSTCEYFGAVFSETWLPSCGGDYSDSSSSASRGCSSDAAAASGRTACRQLPVVLLPEADAEVILALVGFLYTGKLCAPARCPGVCMAPASTTGSAGGGNASGAHSRPTAGCCHCSGLRTAAQLMRLADMLLLPALAEAALSQLQGTFSRAAVPIACRLTLLADLASLGQVEVLEECANSLVQAVGCDTAAALPVQCEREWRQLPDPLASYLQAAWLERRKSGVAGDSVPEAYGAAFSGFTADAAGLGRAATATAHRLLLKHSVDVTAALQKWLLSATDSFSAL